MGHGILDSLDITDTTTATTGGLGALTSQGGAHINDNLVVSGTGTPLQVPNGASEFALIRCDTFIGSDNMNQTMNFTSTSFPSRVHRSRLVTEITGNDTEFECTAYQIQTDTFVSGGGTASVSTLIGVEFEGDVNGFAPSTYIHLKTTTNPGTATNVFAAEFDNRVRITDTTASTSPTNGSFLLSGGAGIQGNMNIGGLLGMENTTAATTGGLGALVLQGGAYINDNLVVNGSGTPLRVPNGILSTNRLTVASSSSASTFNSSAMSISGGLYVGNNIVINGSGNIFQALNGSGVISSFSITSTNQSNSTTTGALTCAGGTGIQENLNVGGLVGMKNTTAATTGGLGALVLQGGAYINDNLVVDGSGTPLQVPNGTASIDSVLITGIEDCTGSDTGALQCAGGLNVKKTAFFEENMAIRGTVGDIANFGLYVGAPPATTSLSNYGFLDNSGTTGFSAGFTANYSAFFEDRVRVGGILAVQSDGRLKRDIEDLKESNFMNIFKMKPKKYHWKRQKKSEWHYGLIAQEVEALMPELVNYARTFIYLEDDLFGDKQHLTLPQDIIDENPGDEMRIQKVNEKDEVYGPHISVHLEPTKTPGTYKLKEAYRGRFKVIGYYLNDCRDINYIGLIPHIIQAMKVIFEKVSLLEGKSQGISKGERIKRK